MDWAEMQRDWEIKMHYRLLYNLGASVTLALEMTVDKYLVVNNE